MKLREIRRFTRWPNYMPSFSLDGIEHNLQRWIEEYHLDLDPDFQRAHVWTEEQQIAYVEYLYRGGEFGRDILFNMPHWGSGRNDIGRMELVDGKQRLEACRKWIHNELPIFGKQKGNLGHTLMEWEDWQSALRSVTLVFRVNSLLTRREVLEWYLELNTGGTIHTPEEIEKVRKMLDTLPTK